MPDARVPIAHLCYGGLSGASTVCLALAGALGPAWEQCIVYFGVEEPRLADRMAARNAGVSTRIIPKRRGLDLRAYREASRALAAHAGETGLVVIHGVQLCPVLLALRTRVSARRCILFFHGPMNEFSGWATWKIWLYARLGGWYATVSEEVRDACHALAPKAARRGRTALIENGVDTTWWTPEEDADPYRAHKDPRMLALTPAGRAPHREARDGIRFCVSGSLTPRKHVERALQTVTGLRAAGLEVELTLCGEGPERARLEEIVRAEGLSRVVAFLGQLDPPALRTVYQRSHYLLHASDSEGLSLAMLEAMACGCPVLLSPHAQSTCGVVPARLAETGAVLSLDATGRARPLATEAAPHGGGEGESIDAAEAWSRWSARARGSVVEAFSLRRQAAAFEALLQRARAAL